MKYSLRTRILVLVLGLVVVVIGTLGARTYRSERAGVMLVAFHDAQDYAQIVDNTLRAAMLSQSPAAVTMLVQGIARSTQIAGTAIYTADGQPAFHTTTAPLSSEGKEVLATRIEWGGEETVDRQPVYRVFRPIATSTDCYKCHESSDPIAGVTQMDMSLKLGYERVAAQRNQALRDGAMLIVVITFVIWFFMSRTVVRPLRVMAEGARRIAAGDLSERVPPGGSGEIGELATSFNVMADELERRISELEDAREKLETSIHRVADALSSALDMSSIIRILITESLSVGHFELGLVALVDGSTYDHARPPSDEADAEVRKAERAMALETLRARLQQINLSPPALSTTRALYRSADAGVDELGLDPIWETVFVLPMFSEGQHLGQLVLASRGHVILSTSQRRLLEFLSTQGATAVTQRYLHERTREMAITDGLTGLFDHRHFYETLEVEMARAARYGLALSLVLLDIDHFKEYNDRVGHPGGDVLLRQLADLLRIAVRETDIVARYGGEEFTVILPHTSLADSVALAERIRVAVEQEPFPHASGQHLGGVTVSAGVATRLDDADTVDGLVEAADKALYAAKARGRNLVVAYEQLWAGDSPEPPPDS